MNHFLNAIMRSYQKIISQNDDHESIPHDILMPLINSSDFEKLCTLAENNFSSQSIILSISSPTYVVGDLHGNIFDLLRILKQVGDITQTKILFLGDYVDRGQFSVEVVTLLFCLSCLYPENVFLIRGNHEFRKVNENYGFKKQIIDVFKSISPWEKANYAFDCLPLAAIIDNRIFCVHGGITPLLKNITDLKTKYHRPICNFEDEILYDLMWGDPTSSYENYMPSLRGIGRQFGCVALHKFLTENNLTQMIRGHQCVKNGIERSFKNQLITVFSSSNYGEIPDACAAFLYVDINCSLKDFTLHPYDVEVKRESTHFVQINTKLLSMSTHLESLSIQSPQRTSMIRTSSNMKMGAPSARPTARLLEKPFLLQPSVKRNSYFNMKPTFATPVI
ncbi:hypothetical protein M9Y10_038251 [Tritrichomonas musculus]|uniref:Serine/threonine-protein phosphatase n=1 Tax=Tritrichomonas musculus TaxID=1915356 RepID=A0ABR2K7V6_9EUKA